MNKCMNKILFVLFITVIIAMIGAAILQIFFPTFLGGTTDYGMNAGWQREIGIWNLGMITILVGTLLKGSLNTVKIVASGAAVLGIGFGTNHLVGFFNNAGMYINLVGALENYLLVALLFWGLKMVKSKRVK